MTSDENLVQRAVGWLGGFFTWLYEQCSTDLTRRAVLSDLGLDPAKQQSEELKVVPMSSITDYQQRTSVDEQAFISVWNDVLAVVEAVDGFVEAAGVSDRAVVKEYVRLLLSLRATEYVRLTNPKAYFIARLLAVIEEVAPRQFHGPADVLLSRDVFTNLVGLLKAPIDHFERAYSTPETEDDARLLAANTLIPLGILVTPWTEQTTRHKVRLVGSEYEVPFRKVLHGWDIPTSTSTPVADRLSEHVLSIELVDFGLAATLVWIPRAHGGPGLYVRVTGTAEDAEIPVGSTWTVNVTKPSPDALDVLIWSSVERGPGAPAAAADAALGDHLVLTFRPMPTTPTQPYVLTLFGTRLEIGELSIILRIADDHVELKVLAKRSALVVRRGDGDGFVARLLPENGVRLDFELGIGLAMTPKPRMFLEGGSGLQTTIPINRSIGPARVQQLYLELASGDNVPEGGLRFETSIAASVKLGPITATVDRLGFALVIDTDGGRRPDIGFKAPTGVGLVIDAEVASGSGYLFYDAAKGQYAGIIQLQLADFTLQAIGILTTGERGFSLLIIVAAADFTPINIGFGFTLTGIGGVLGYNRTVDIEPLRSGLKQGALDAVLFPANPVRDAPRIISVLDTIMPPKEDQFLVGPTAQITWGGLKQLTIELAVIIEAPSPWRLVVLGQLRALLPTEDNKIVRLQMDALGVVDFDRGEVAVDAVLYDSKITEYPITGDMALRARFGSDPTFALAVGGLHPKFNPPAGFPKLARVTVGLSAGDNAKLTLQAYLALTSNTVQVGARLDLVVKSSGFSVEGTLSFDALFQFSPFSFIVDIHAGITLKWHGRTLFGVELDLTLSGPSPWNARGKATFKIWRFSKSVSFDRTLGGGEPPPALPAANPLPELIAALSDRRNWSAELPPTVSTLVTMRATPPTTDVLLHPLGELTVRQRVVPLGIVLDRFGSSSITGDRRFDVAVLGTDGKPAEGADVVMDHFAAAQFLDMSDVARLQRPSFELMGAGVRVGETAATWGGRDDPTLIANVEMSYETFVVGEPDSRDRRAYSPTADQLRLAAALGAVARSPARHTGPARYRAPRRAAPPPRTTYTIVSRSDLSDVAVPEVAAGAPSYTAASQALDRHVALHPELRGRLQVTEVVR